MSMPQIPDGKNRPSFEETIIDLLESVALEEMAVSHIMNAEGEKLQEIIRKFYCNEIGFCEVEYSCKNMHSMVNSLIMKEWLLLNKLGTIMEVNQSIGKRDNPEAECDFNRVKAYPKSPCQKERQESVYCHPRPCGSRHCDIQYDRHACYQAENPPINYYRSGYPKPYEEENANNTYKK